MSIPYWRESYYTDDGCSVYQCLSCYTEWESRTSPHYSKWRFCPVCGIEWSGEKKWDSEKKWERKVGQNPGPHDRLSRPLFIIQTRFIPFEDEGVESEWENLSNSNSVCLLSAVFHLSYESERELASDPFLGFNEYRVIFDPFKVDSFLDSYRKEPRTSQNQPLQWKQHLNGDVGQTILESWRKYQRNMKEIRKRAEKLRNKSA